VDTEALRHRGVDLLEESQDVRSGEALVSAGEDLAGRDVHRREQVDGAVAFLVVGHVPA